MRCGLQPPFSGTVNNPYKDSCGAYIRSEIWACLAPGCPEIAVKYAYEDALVDHGEGEGLYAEVFCAAMESAAFLEKDIRRLLQIGLSYIPDDCAVARAVRLAEKLYDDGTSWQEARDEILRNFLGGFIFTISDEDVEKGFTNGKVGWEAPSNIWENLVIWATSFQKIYLSCKKELKYLLPRFCHCTGLTFCSEMARLMPPENCSVQIIHGYTGGRTPPVSVFHFLISTYPMKTALP